MRPSPQSWHAPVARQGHPHCPQSPRRSSSTGGRGSRAEYPQGPCRPATPCAPRTTPLHCPCPWMPPRGAKPTGLAGSALSAG
eukprot:10712691-Lingulodinium_polyedra.AAC.1